MEQPGKYTPYRKLIPNLRAKKVVLFTDSESKSVQQSNKMGVERLNKCYIE